MAIPIYPLRDIAGNIITPGRLHLSKKWDAIDGEMPAEWLTNAISIYQTPAEGVPGMIVYQSDAPNAEIAPITELLRTSDMSVTSIRIKGLQSRGGENFNAVYLNLDNTASDNGVLAFSTSNVLNSFTTAVARGVGTSNNIVSAHKLYRNLVDANLQDTVPAEQVFRSVDFGLMVNWQTKQVYVFDGDQVVLRYDATAILTTDGVINPRIRLRALSDTRLLVSAVEFDAWYY